MSPVQSYYPVRRLLVSTGGTNITVFVENVLNSEDIYCRFSAGTEKDETFFGVSGSSALSKATLLTTKSSTGQYVGVYTNIDAIHDSTNAKKISDNPMDSKWAGITYTQQMVDSGKYVDNEVSKPSLFNAKTVFYPSIPSVVPPPKDIIG